MLSLVQPYFSDIHLGDIIDVETLLAPLLSNATIWGVNLYHVGLADTVCTFFSEMIKSPGAVLNTLKKYIYIFSSHKQQYLRTFLKKGTAT